MSENKIECEKWELINENGPYRTTYRMRVFGGWIVKSESLYYSEGFSAGASESMCFVPDPNGDWKL